MNTYIVRENRKIKNKKITINIPDSFAFDEVEVIILPIAARKQKTKKNSIVTWTSRKNSLGR